METTIEKKEYNSLHHELYYKYKQASLYHNKRRAWFGCLSSVLTCVDLVGFVGLATLIFQFESKFHYIQQEYAFVVFFAIFICLLILGFNFMFNFRESEYQERVHAIKYDLLFADLVSLGKGDLDDAKKLKSIKELQAKGILITTEEKQNHNILKDLCYYEVLRSEQGDEVAKDEYVPLRKRLIMHVW